MAPTDKQLQEMFREQFADLAPDDAFVDAVMRRIEQDQMNRIMHTTSDDPRFH